MEGPLQFKFRPNRAKRKFLAGEPVTWVLLDMMTVELAQMLGTLGVDCLMMEGEHAAYNEEKIVAICRVAEITGMTPIIRLRTISYDQIGRLLDLGVQGIHATHIRSKAECEHLIKCAKYPPLGERGWGQFAPINGYGMTSEAAGVAMGNDEVLLSICIEDIEGAENIEEICQAEGIDFIAIGRSDLSASMGIPGEYKDPRFRQVIADIEAAIAASPFADKKMLGGAPNVKGGSANYIIAKGFFEHFGGTVAPKTY